MIDISLMLTFIAMLAFIYFYNRDIAKEREQLYDRIQSKDLTDYKNSIEVIESKPREEREQNDAYVEL